MEGHPDNVAAALLGGFTTAWIESPEEDPPHTSALVRPAHTTVQPVVAIPAAPVPTAHARTLLEASVTRESAVFNIARTAALTHALCIDPGLLFTATEDRLHQDARAAAYPDSHQLMSTMRAQGFPTVISGAGPTVMVLTETPDDAIRALQGATDGTWRILAVAVDTDGVRSRTRSLG
jgi:homoserine kinase